MPITKQAIKRAKQNLVHQSRNQHYVSRMKSMIKLIMRYLKESQLDKAKEILADVMKSIDMAAKKHLLHRNNASRRKSGVQKAMNAAAAGKPTHTTPAQKKPATAKKPAAGKKPAAKKAKA